MLLMEGGNNFFIFHFEVLVHQLSDSICDKYISCAANSEKWKIMEMQWLMEMGWLDHMVGPYRAN